MMIFHHLLVVASVCLAANALSPPNKPLYPTPQVESIKAAPIAPVTPQAYVPTWDSIDSRPLPTWYDDSKVGIFIHWGVYSVPSFGSEWFWYSLIHDKSESHEKFMEKNYPPGFTYQDFGVQFTAEFFDPSQWADLFKKSGAKYVVLTSKHHEGYTLWPSRYSFSWNSMETGPHRDLVGDLANAVRERTDLRFGLYHSLYEWYNPLYMNDKQNKWTTDEFVQFKVLPEMKELVQKYKPEILWSDGEWEAPAEYWKSLDFLAWLYNESPVNTTVVTNDRWGDNTLCTHGGYYTCTDRYNPGVLLPHKWENCMTLDKESWGYRRDSRVRDYLTPEELLKTLVETISCGGNLLVNVGPTKEGTINPLMEERLVQLGEWLGVNGEAVYESKPWTYQNDTFTPGVWYTSNPSRKQVYAFVLNWPGSEVYLASIPSATVKSVRILGSSVTPQFYIIPSGGISVAFPRQEQITSQWAWTVVINQ